jgi:uncharacterized delta-60 repeat protein
MCLKISMLFLLTFVSFTLTVYAVPPGTLDTAFGTNGLAKTDVSTADDEIWAVAVQSDNKIIAAGYSGKPAAFTIARYNANGTLDTTFGTSGIAKPFSSTGNTYARAVVIQADGKIVVGGDAEGNFALVRYTTTGQLDTSFGTGGKVITEIEPGSLIQGLALQSDGKIIAVGYTGGISDFAVARYNTNGSPDTSFGTGGVTITDFGAKDYDRATSVKLQSNGKIVVAGSGVDADLFAGFAIACYNTDGLLDASFGTDGKVVTPNDSEAKALGIQGDGKITLTGAVNYDIFLARYNTDGSLDTGFGNNGTVSTDINGNQDAAHAINVESSGKVLVVGSTISNGNEDFALVKYNPSGVRDTTFDNGDGIVTTSLNTNSDIAYAVSIQPNGGIIVGGSKNDFSVKEFAVTRYVGYQATAANVSVGGRLTSASGNGLAGIRVSLMNMQGVSSYTLTNSFGYYTFSDIPAGETYIIAPNSAKHTFSPSARAVNVMEDVTGVDFTAN